MTLFPSLRRTTTLLLNGSIALITAICAPACSSGTGGTPTANPPGVPEIDLHGDIPGSATRIFADGAVVSGAINHGGDVDWFKFAGSPGVVYVLQYFGFPAPSPDITFNSLLNPDPLNPLGPELVAQIVRPDGATQLLNTSGNDAGTPFDVDPLGFEVEDGIRIDDTRIVLVAISSASHFIKMVHDNDAAGTGNYRFSLSSAQQAFTFAVPGFKSNTRSYNIIDPTDDDATLLFNGTLTGGFLGSFLEITPSSAEDILFTVGQSFGFSIPEVFFLDDEGVPEDDPQTRVVHLHAGIPHIQDPVFDFIPGASGATPHPFLISIEFAKRKSADGQPLSEVVARSPDGSRVDGITGTLEDDPERPGYSRINLNLNAEIPKGGAGEDGPVIRLLMDGYEFFLDAHFTDQLELLDTIAPSRNLALVSSDAYAGVDTLFETEFVLTPGNVVPPAPGFNPDMSIFYDASLRVFQLAYQLYQQPSTQHPYVGGQLSIHRGGPGEVGPVLIDLGTLPPNTQPPFFNDFFPEPQTGFAPEGHALRLPLLQLTDEQTETLRQAFYTGGFYLQITTPQFPNGAVRAEGFLEIQLDPNDPGKFGPSAKGRVSFETEYTAGGPVTVVLNGKNLGELDGTVTSLSDELYADDYYYRAIAEDGTEWDGIVTVAGNGSHETILLSAN